MKKRKIFRQVLGGESKKDDVENLLSPQEWFDMFRQTCTGLLKVNTPAAHYQIIYFIYCAVITMKFGEELLKVQQSILVA